MRTPSSCSVPTRSTSRGGGCWRCGRSCPSSDQAWVVDPTHGDRTLPMRRIHPAGLFEAICPLPHANGNGSPARYMLRVAEEGGKKTITMHDPYSFPHLLTDYDLHLLNEGRHWQCYNRLGAQLRKIDGVDGVNFAVWAPNATSVSLVGDFNNWDGRRHPMRKHIPSGFWELFVPGLGEGTLYKYQIRHNDGVFEKSDPFGFAAEVPPRTASQVADLNRYAWHDARLGDPPADDELAGTAVVVLRGAPGQLEAARRRSHAAG